jgi:glycogenin glucosyltransferase
MAEAFVSLATNDGYAKGALVLGQSLRENKTSKKLVLMITNDVTQATRDQLSRVWDSLEVVNPIDSGERENLILLQRPDLGITFTKLQAWRLVQFQKCVFLDADTLVLDNVDELFERDELSAAPDVGWPDCFNSGVFVFAPSLDTYSKLIEFAAASGSFDGGDQGLLNSFFNDWASKDIRKHLPFIYNVTPNAAYGYTPAFKKFGHGIKIIHFIGSVKPWHHQLTSTGLVFLKPGTYSSQASVVDYIQIWWNHYARVTDFLSGSKGQSVEQYTGTCSTQGNSLPETNIVIGNPNTPSSISGGGPVSGPPPVGGGPVSAPPPVGKVQLVVPPPGGGSQVVTPPPGGVAIQPGPVGSVSGVGSAVGSPQQLVTQTSQQSGVTVVSVASTDELRKAAWSRGQPDYMGQDRFDNIQAKLDASLQSKPPPSQKGKTSSSAGETKKEEIQEIQITF